MACLDGRIEEGDALEKQFAQKVELPVTDEMRDFRAAGCAQRKRSGGAACAPGPT